MARDRDWQEVEIGKRWRLARGGGSSRQRDKIEIVINFFLYIYLIFNECPLKIRG